MIDVTFGLAILLTGGMLFAKIVQLFNLPSVTGFILAGLALGPSGFSIITAETVGHNLDHFIQIALMLIAFGIGEHIELRRLGSIAKQVTFICVGQATAAFTMVTLFCFLLAMAISPEQTPAHHAVLALILGAVSLANAPAAILHIVRELDARGPFTSTLIAVIALGDGLSIATFGVVVSIAHQMVSPNQVSLLAGIFGSFYEIGGSIAIGAGTGLLIDLVLHKTHKRGEMLTTGLAMLLLCGEITRLLALSPLLAGMTAGFILINREERDIRLFRILNGFEPPVYVLFFTLAGVHLDLGVLKLAGWVGAVYFLFRFFGKYLGSWLGALLAGAPETVKKYIGLGLFPQAGIAIGLVFVINSDPLLAPWYEKITPIVLAGVVLAELFGPITAKKAFAEAGEISPAAQLNQHTANTPLATLLFSRSRELHLSPWASDELYPAANPQGVVIFGSANYATVRGLARVATILAHHFDALPLSVRVKVPGCRWTDTGPQCKSLFLPETDEVKSLGYPLQTMVIEGQAVSSLIQAVQQTQAKALVLGYPLGRNPLAMQKIVERVARSVSCPVVVVRFIGTFSCDRILVPFLSLKELDLILPVIEAMGTAREPAITLMHLLHADCTRKEILLAEDAIGQWLASNLLELSVESIAVPAGSRLEAILDEARHHDLIIMKATRRKGISKLFIGSLAAAVVTNCPHPVFTVYPGKKADIHQQPFADPPEEP